MARFLRVEPQNTDLEEERIRVNLVPDLAPAQLINVKS